MNGSKSVIEPSMETIVSLCKRRGFIFQSSEIYGGCNGFFDYGPLGVELRKNIKDAWWHDIVHCREDVVGIDCSIIMHPKVWQASGHIGGFSDPMVDCKESKLRYRADQLFFGEVIVAGENIGYISLLENGNMQTEADEKADSLKRKLGKQGLLEKVVLKPYTEAKPHEYILIPSPGTGKAGSLTPPRDFNLMFQTYIGALRDESAIAYLRPETAQGMFVNFRNVVDTSRVKVPFGIAQMGRSFRNEITPRNFVFRSREFEQMEMEYFIAPDADWEKLHADWIESRLNWHKSIGLREELLGLDVHPKNKLAHYSRACTDITFKYPFGVQELEGIAARGCFDLTQHQEASGKSLEYFDEEKKAKYLPHVIEPAVGVDRIFLAILCSAYDEDEIEGEKRTVLRFHPRMAPIKVGVFPLVKNKPELVEKSRNLYKKLQRRWPVAYDAAGAIGRRYRRMDEVGTPFGVTIDYETLENGTVTLRDRDTTKQIRLNETELFQFLDEKINP
ncbi:MAG: glycine--tRNA ligase [Verrucomicrobia bacterium GWC2_42_7]|nr:MAG: glycine--tRNA ligase [Verrucomicrobia bacterium GWC2_42_7]